MRRSGGWHVFAALALSLGLSACNTTDALTPQVDIGGGTQRGSSPVTQADTDRMAGAYASEPMQSAPLAAPPAAPLASNTYPRRQSNTLDSQARALEDGDAVSPSSSGPPPEWEGQSADNRDGMTSSSPTDQAALPPASADGSAAIRFLPIIGAPVEAVTPLSRQLAIAARSSGVRIRPSGDTGTKHILKGYFSALSDDGKVTVVYVWDVLDSSGARLHRMQGQETLSAQGTDPWAAIPASVMQSIADKTISGYLDWRQTASRL